MSNQFNADGCLQKVSSNVIEKIGYDRMKDPLLNIGSSTPLEERDTLKLRGLLPSGYLPLRMNVERNMQLLRSKTSPIEKYIFLQSIQDIDER